MSNPQEWYLSVPAVTRAWLTAAVITTIGSRFGFVPVAKLAFDASAVVNKFEVRRPCLPSAPAGCLRAARLTIPRHVMQIWRLLLNFTFFGKPSFNWIIQMLML